MSLFHREKAQPKQDHSSLTRIDVPFDLPPVPLQVQEEIVIGPIDDIGWMLPALHKSLAQYTPRELAAKREFVRRMQDGGATESLWFMQTVDQMAEELGMSKETV